MKGKILSEHYQQIDILKITQNNNKTIQKKPQRNKSAAKLKHSQYSFHFKFSSLSRLKIFKIPEQNKTRHQELGNSLSSSHDKFK